MDNYLHSHFLAVARAEWKTKKSGNYEMRDQEAKGKVNFLIFHASAKDNMVRANIRIIIMYFLDSYLNKLIVAVILILTDSNRVLLAR